MEFRLPECSFLVFASGFAATLVIVVGSRIVRGRSGYSAYKVTLAKCGNNSRV